MDLHKTCTCGHPMVHHRIEENPMVERDGHAENDTAVKGCRTCKCKKFNHKTHEHRHSHHFWGK